MMNSIGGISYVDPETYVGAVPVSLAAEVEDNYDINDIKAAITAAGGVVQAVDDLYGRSVVFFTVDDLDSIYNIENIDGVYLVKERYTTYPWSYDPVLDAVPEEEAQVVTDYMFLPLDDRHEYLVETANEDVGIVSSVREFWATTQGKVVTVGVVALVLYLVYGKR